MTDKSKYCTNLNVSHLHFILSFHKDVSQSCQNGINPSALHATDRHTSEFKHEFPQTENTHTFLSITWSFKKHWQTRACEQASEIDMTCWGFDWNRTSRGTQPPIFAKYNEGFERTQAIFHNWNMHLTVQMKMCPSNPNCLFGHLHMAYPHVPTSIRIW